MKWGTLAVMGLTGAAAIGLASIGRGEGAEMGGPMTVHEWGTFTNFSTSDGVQHAFGSPIGRGSDLPEFVMGYAPDTVAAEQAPISGWKESLVSRQRMETPVIYIYPGCEEKADVEARLLNGQMTEFYPPLNGAAIGKSGKADKSVVRWEGITLQNREAAKPISAPKGEKRSHYFEARETDAGVLGVEAMGTKHYEKFLFYRGAAEFESKLTVRALGKDRFEVRNATGEKIPAAFVMSVEAGAVRWAAMGEIGAKKDGSLPVMSTSAEALVEALRGELVKAGLFEKEAAAMVATWRAYWFDEPGTRVLAIWPRGEVDRVLQLKVTPTPVKTERVFVGRMDVVTPETEERIATTLRAMEGKTGDAADSEWKKMPKLGRFLGPAVRGVAERSRDAKMIAAAQRAGN